MSDTDDELKLIEVSQKHFTDLFVYQARQRLDSIRFYLLAAAVGANVIVGAGASNLAKGVIAAIAGFITLIFLRLDYRNAQIVEVDEKPLRYLQELTRKRMSVSEEWVTFSSVEKGRSRLASYGSLVPALYGLIWAAWFTASVFFIYRWLGTGLISEVLVFVYSFFLLSAGCWATFCDKPKHPAEVREQEP